MIELRQLRYLIAASEAGSFNRGARKLGIKQATLSRHIALIEQRLGFTIFDRSVRGALLTPDGETYFRWARRLVGEFDELNHWVREKRVGQLGDLSIGFHTSLSAGNLRATLASFTERYPAIEVQCIERDRTRLLQGVESGALDIALLIGEVAEAGLMHQSFWSDRIVVALPEGHALTARCQLTFPDLVQERFLFTTRDPGPQQLKLLAAKIGTVFREPDAAMEDISRESLLCRVSMGGCITLTSEAVAGIGIAGVVFRDLVDATGQMRAGYSGYWRADNRNPVLKRFLDFVRMRYSLPPPRA